MSGEWVGEWEAESAPNTEGYFTAGRLMDISEKAYTASEGPYSKTAKIMLMRLAVDAECLAALIAKSHFVSELRLATDCVNEAVILANDAELEKEAKRER